MKTYTFTFFDQPMEIAPIAMKYESDNSLAIVLYDVKEQEEFDTITVNLSSFKQKGNRAFLDINNCDWAIGFLEKHKLAKRLPESQFSGFVNYPLYEFDLSKINLYEDLPEI